MNAGKLLAEVRILATVYFATNRNQTRDPAAPFGDRFHLDGPQFYRAGWAEVRRDDADGEGYVIDRIDLAPEADRTQKPEEVPGSTAVFSDLQNDMAAEQADAIILIHGYASSFETALKRAAQIQDAYVFTTAPSRGIREIRPQVFVFSWPSNGSMAPFWSYADDRQDAAFSGVAMARALARMLVFLRERAPRDHDTRVIHCNQRIHLVAHSMGNWALRHAVLALCQLFPAERITRMFDNIFLMAADEDADALEHKGKLGLLPQLGRNVHVYYSHEDGALMLSKTSKLNGDRLGAAGPKSFASLPNNVYAIDCVSVDDTTGMNPGVLHTHANHQYYRMRREVIEDVRQVLAGVRPEAIMGRTLVEPRRYRIEPAKRPRKTSGKSASAKNR